ncbi:hypothetical protein BDR07DRAFT_1410160 [Suillus spraguei]|nr:hypothetical protein BDR07DRAFT_1410160 [Suillus spraguei]
MIDLRLIALRSNSKQASTTSQMYVFIFVSRLRGLQSKDMKRHHNETIQHTIAAALHGRRSRRGQRRDRTWVLSIPIARLLATFARAFDCPTPLHVPRFLSISPIGCAGPHLGLGTPAHVNSTFFGIGGRYHPGRDLVVARAWNIGPVLQALLVFDPVRHLSARWVGVALP